MYIYIYIYIFIYIHIYFHFHFHIYIYIYKQLEYTLLKADCHSWWISKMQSGREDILEERYAIKVCFKLGKMMAQKRMECFRLLFDHIAWIEHQFLSDIRDSRKAGCLYGMKRGVGGVRKSIHQSWLAKGFGWGLLCWGFKGVQEDIPLQEARTLRIGSVAFPRGQYISQQLHPCHTDYLTKMGINTIPHPPYSLDLDLCDFYETIEEMKEAVTKVIETLTQEDFHWVFDKLLERYKCIAAGGDYFEGD